MQLLELKLEQQTDPLQRLILIDQVASHYAYTNVQRAKELLNEQMEILKTHDYPDFRLNCYLNLATIENQLYNFSGAERLFLWAIQLLDEIGNVKQLAETYIDIAGTYMNLVKMDSASAYLEKAEKLLRNFPDERLAARIVCREGFMHLHYSDYSRATELLLEADKKKTALRSQLELKDYYFLTLIHSGLGKIYEINDESEKSARAYQKVVDMCEAMGMRTRLSWHYLNLGTAYMTLSDLDSAERYFQRAIAIADDASQYARASAYANLGYCRYERKMYQEALELFDRAEGLYRQKSEEDYLNFSIIEAWRGRLFAETGQYEKAVQHFAQAFEDAQMVKDYKQLASICKDVAGFYAEISDYKNAYEYQLLQDKFGEQHLEEINKRKQLELEVKYEAEKKKQETELLRLQATRLQLKALRAQMNPHFMYNALNAIQNYITSHEVNSASKYLAKFAQLMRQSLENSDLEIITLEKEIEFLEDYLYINEKLRFQNRLEYEILVDDEIEEDILGVPTMIVQPYVENAIEHGLRSKENGKISLQFRLLDEDTILCIVEDNGIGREKARQLRDSNPQYQNYRSRGTSITEKRLQILHNSKDHQAFVKTIDLIDHGSGEALGTRVEIKIPIIEIQMK
jgi:two-component system LytT family sensor kinase